MSANKNNNNSSNNNNTQTERTDADSWYASAQQSVRYAQESVSRENMRRHYENARDAFNRYLDQAKDTASKTYETARGKTAEVTQWLSDQANPKKEAQDLEEYDHERDAQTWYESAMDSFRRATTAESEENQRSHFERAKQSFNYYLESAKDTGSQMYDTSKQKMTEIDQRLGEMVSSEETTDKDTKPSFVNKVRNVVSGAAQKVADVVKPADENAKASNRG